MNHSKNISGPSVMALNYFWHWVEESPDAPYIVDHSLERPEQQWSYREFADIVKRTVSALRRAGIGQGDIVAVQVPNGWEFIALTFAAWQLGAAICPVMPIFRLHEVEQILEQTGARLLVLPRVFRTYDYSEMAHTLAESFPQMTIWFRGNGDYPDFSAILADMELEDPPDSPAQPDDMAEIVFTSGTTGRPKGVVHTHRTLLTGLLLLQSDFLHMDRTDSVFMASPLAHQTGFLYGVLLPVVLGIPVVLQDIWEAGVALALLSQWGVTFSMGATPFLADLTAQYDPEQHDLSRLKIFISAGAPIPRVLVEQAHGLLGVHILAGWGMSENSLVTLVRPEDGLEKTYTTDGRPVPEMQCRVVDAQGAVLGVMAEGELQVKGPQNFIGYYHDEETTREIMDPQGWLKTGDMAVIDAEGYIRITGRVRDMINRGGEKVPVADVEEMLYRHPAIKEAALVAIPDPRLVNRACACVVLKPGCHMELPDLLHYLERMELTKQFWPERLEVLDAMPKTPSGKIQKYRLREWVEQRRAPLLD